MEVIKYENLVLEAQRDVYQTQLQRCQDEKHEKEKLFSIKLVTSNFLIETK